MICKRKPELFTALNAILINNLHTYNNSKIIRNQSPVECHDFCCLRKQMDQVRPLMVTRLSLIRLIQVQYINKFSLMLVIITMNLVLLRHHFISTIIIIIIMVITVCPEGKYTQLQEIIYNFEAYVMTLNIYFFHWKYHRMYNKYMYIK